MDHGRADGESDPNPGRTERTRLANTLRVVRTPYICSPAGLAPRAVGKARLWHFLRVPPLLQLGMGAIIACEIGKRSSGEHGPGL